MTIPGSSAEQGAGMNLQSLQRKVDLGEQLLEFFDKVEGKGSFIRGKMIMIGILYINMIDTALYTIAIKFKYHIFATGVVNLEMCDALIKIAIHLASNISEA